MNKYILVLAVLFITGCAQKQTEVVCKTEFIKDKIVISEDIFLFKENDIPDGSNLSNVKIYIKDLYIENMDLKERLNYIKNYINNYNKGELK